MELEVLGRQLERAVIFSGLEKLAEASLCVIRKCKGFLQQGVKRVSIRATTRVPALFRDSGLRVLGLGLR